MFCVITNNMKSIVALACLLALTAAEPPPNSYLPPAPAGRNGGNGALPQVAVARTNGFGSTGSGGPQGYDANAQAFSRNGLEGGFGGEPANYNFEYMVNDQHHGTDFGHHEERHDDSARGQYHVVLPDGRKQTVNYEADERGFKPRVSYQGSEGYDSNAQLVGTGFGGRSGGY